MNTKGGGLSSPPLKNSSGLENPPSVLRCGQNLNSGEFAIIDSQAGLNSINEGFGTTAKEFLTVQPEDKPDQSSVVRKFRTTDRVTGRFISRLQKYQLTEKGRRLLAQLDKEGRLS